VRENPLGGEAEGGCALAGEQQMGLIRRLAKAATEKTLDELAELVSSHSSEAQAGPNPWGLGDAPFIEREYGTAFPDFEVAIENVRIEADSVRYDATLTGTHQTEFLGVSPTYKRIVVHTTEAIHVSPSGVLEARSIVVGPHLSEQLGTLKRGFGCPVFGCRFPPRHTH
jgi:predicted ester cyclase